MFWLKKRKKKPCHCSEHWEYHFHIIEWLIRRLTLIVLKMKPEKKGYLRIGIHLIKESTVPNTPVVMTSEQRLPIGITAVKPDGSVDTDVDVVFSSSDPSVGIEEQPDGRSALVTTPGETGSATITVSATGYEDQKLDVSYAPPVKGQLNLTVGVPESDL